MMKKKHAMLTIIIVFFLMVILILLVYPLNTYIASDGAFYNQIAKGIIKNEQPVFKAELMEDRPVQYPLLFFMQNAVFMLFFGLFQYRVLISIIALLILVLIDQIFRFKRPLHRIIFMATSSIIFLSSNLFYTVLRYKIETFVFFFVFLAIYLIRKKTTWAFYVLCIVMGVCLAMKQLCFILLPIILIPLLNEKHKLKKLFFGALIILFIAAPFYIALKASTGVFLGSPTMVLPILDDTEISLKSVEKTKLYNESRSLPKASRMQSVSEPSTGYNVFKRNSIIFSLTGSVFLTICIFFLLILRELREHWNTTLTILLLIIGSVLTFSYIIQIWAYFLYASFLFDILFIFLLLKFLFAKNSFAPMLLLLLLMLVSYPNASDLFEKIEKTRLKMQNIEDYKVSGDFYGFGNRAYELGNYLERPILFQQKASFDYFTKRDENWDLIFSSFYDKNITFFIEQTRKRGINHIVFFTSAKDFNSTARRSLKAFYMSGTIEPTYESDSLVVYRIVRGKR